VIIAPLDLDKEPETKLTRHQHPGIITAPIEITPRENATTKTKAKKRKEKRLEEDMIFGKYDAYDEMMNRYR